MTTLNNEIVINAPLEKIWEALSVIDNLEKFDPTVKKSTCITLEKSGLHAKRKVDMLDGKNWFEEKVTEFKPNESLKYQLTDCSFPINGLTHSYTFEKLGNNIKVKQVMQYTVKFGVVGKLLDSLMIRKQTNSGVIKFFAGLNEYAEKN
jgi:ribosome-associated toxin RatA of RatAB toxin-antitoxin module